MPIVSFFLEYEARGDGKREKSPRRTPPRAVIAAHRPRHRSLGAVSRPRRVAVLGLSDVSVSLSLEAPPEQQRSGAYDSVRGRQRNSGGGRTECRRTAAPEPRQLRRGRRAACGTTMLWHGSALIRCGSSSLLTNCSSDSVKAGRRSSSKSSMAAATQAVCQCRTTAVVLSCCARTLCCSAVQVLLFPGRWCKA